MYRVLYCTLFEHDLRLVALAAGVCLAALAVTGMLWMRARSAAPRWRLAWLICMGLTSGGGAWATHFIAMLAYQPPVRIGFDLQLTLLSLIVGVGFTASAFVAEYKIKQNWSPLASGSLFAAGVAGLHYIGMAGLEAPAQKLWDVGLVAASVVICVGFAVAAMHFCRLANNWRWCALVCALLGLAIVSLHFTGMGSLTLAPDPTALAVATSLHPVDLAVIIAITATASLLIVALLAFADRRVSAADARSLAKSQFLAAMSHELRTPLTSIISYAEELAETAQNDGRETDHSDAKTIIEASHHLLALISEILDFSKLEAGRFALEMQRVPVQRILDECIKTSEPLITRNFNKFMHTATDTFGDIETDERRLRQCLLNLLSNAGKFTKDGVITLDVREETRDGVAGLRFDVKDTGIGMSAVTLKNLFNPFSQADETITRRFGGTGLGLAITKQLILKLGGAVDVQSKLGLGSTFTLWAPRRLGAAPSQPDQTQTLAEAA